MAAFGTSRRDSSFSRADPRTDAILAHAMDWNLILGLALGLVVTWLAFVAVLWVVRPKVGGLRDLVAVVPDILRLVRDLLLDPATPRGPRLALVGLLGWLVSPIDLIPEFIPVLGPLDDVVVAILVLRWVRRRVGEPALRRLWKGSSEGFQLLSGVLGSDRAADGR